MKGKFFIFIIIILYFFYFSSKDLLGSRTEIEMLHFKPIDYNLFSIFRTYNMICGRQKNFKIEKKVYCVNKVWNCTKYYIIFCTKVIKKDLK